MTQLWALVQQALMTLKPFSEACSTNWCDEPRRLRLQRAIDYNQRFVSILVTRDRIVGTVDVRPDYSICFRNILD
jgi:hypothetical protein